MIYYTSMFIGCVICASAMSVCHDDDDDDHGRVVCGVVVVLSRRQGLLFCCRGSRSKENTLGKRTRRLGCSYYPLYKSSDQRPTCTYYYYK